MCYISGGLAQFLQKIEKRGPLSPPARAAFLALPGTLEEFPTYRDIVSEGDRTSSCLLIVHGCVSRYKSLPDGGRQINSFHFDGDMVDLQSALMVVADHGIRTHSPTTVLRIAARDIAELALEFPEWAKALWFDTLVDAANFREWMLNIGRRSAVGRTAHILLEIACRLQDAGRSDGAKFTMPVTQMDLADAAGLSPVHTNRSLQTLREKGMIRSYGKTMVIEDSKAMKKLADFNDYYLYPEGPRA